MGKKVLLSFVLATMAGALIWFGHAARKVEAGDASFIRAHPETSLFPRAVNMQGRIAKYQDLDQEQAASLFTRALRASPVLIPAWMEMAKLAEQRGQTPLAYAIQDMFTQSLPEVTTWKWQELLLAYDIDNEPVFTDVLNFVFQRLPGRTMDACFVATQYWGGWSEVAKRLDLENLPRFIGHCLRSGQTQAALDAWSRLPDPEGDLNVRLSHYLLHRKEIPSAVSVWEQIKENSENLIYNPGFEHKPLNRAFGWRLRGHKQVTVQRDVFSSKQGRFALHLKFRGTHNVRFHHVYQIVPVMPGQAYTLQYFQKSDGLSTDQGVYLEIRGYQCQGLRTRGPMLTGSSKWEEASLQFQVPDTCRAVLIRVRRNESLKLDNKIKGHYWLDQVVLTPRSGESA
ncbi:MAG: hypothetical protein K9K64_12330 [Desulfohalobiaceae bacterium]|nr:hypothetical protein [Desulfohalobiaceae bacterium]